MKARIRALRRGRRLSQEALAAPSERCDRPSRRSRRAGTRRRCRRPYSLSGRNTGGLPAGLAPAAACVPVKSAAALRGEYKARALIIRENDERSFFIAQKTGMICYKSVAAGYFSAALFEAAVRAALHACCARKL